MSDSLNYFLNIVVEIADNEVNLSKGKAHRRILSVAKVGNPCVLKKKIPAENAE
jgi:hypothetical protein